MLLGSNGSEVFCYTADTRFASPIYADSIDRILGDTAIQSWSHPEPGFQGYHAVPIECKGQIEPTPIKAPFMSQNLLGLH